MKTKYYTKLQELCDNGTRSCLISKILSELKLSRMELMEILCDAPFSYRLSKNINHSPLLIIEEDDE